MSSKVSSTLPSQVLPDLPQIDTSKSNESTSPAVKQIHFEADVVIWQQSAAHQNLVLFLARLCESSVGKGTRVWVKGSESSSTEEKEGCLEGVLMLLNELQSWTTEIEPLKSPQRFGNLAFRSWGQRLEERLTSLHKQLLPSRLHPYIAELETYLLGSFGSWVRLDYGSGHELSFLAWLCYLARLGAFSGKNIDGGLSPKAEERLALEVFPKYLQIVWGLQDRYGLEPAGSHGVWGLDDYQFIPYAIGAAQLRNQNSYLPSIISSTSHKPDPPKLPIDQLLQFIPRPSSSTTSSRTSDSTGVPPFPNLYTSSIARIHSLKRGPFSEHSPILYDVALTVPNWIKVHSGMMKMWQAECLGKLPVIQHFPFGKVAFVWEGDVKTRDKTDRIPTQAVRAEPTTGAPWKNGTPAMPPTGAPWKTGNAPMPPTKAPWEMGGITTMPATGAVLPSSNSSSSSMAIPSTGAPWAKPSGPRTDSMASTGSAAAASSPFGIISKPSIPSRSRKE